MQTAREKLLSITGACKNISRLVTVFETNPDIIRDEIEEEFEYKIPKKKTNYDDVESLLQICTELKDDMITVSKRIVYMFF